MSSSTREEGIVKAPPKICVDPVDPSPPASWSIDQLKAYLRKAHPQYYQCSLAAMRKVSLPSVQIPTMDGLTTTVTTLVGGRHVPMTRVMYLRWLQMHPPTLDKIVES